MWKNWCFHMLQLKVKGYTPFIKGYLAIFFLLLELIHGFLIFVYWSIFCIFFLIFVYLHAFCAKTPAKVLYNQNM